MRMVVVRACVCETVSQNHRGDFLPSDLTDFWAKATGTEFDGAGRRGL